jgi:SAM-dependent methyltransferase
MVLLPFEAEHVIPLRRAPDVQAACTEAYGPRDEPYVASLRELLGIIGAHEWRRKGVEIAAVGGRIHPHYGVFSPVRGEYVQLVAETPLPSTDLAFDIGTGTGVLAAVLARRGVKRIVATDQDPRALACARENIARLDLDAQVDVVQADLFPEGRAPLVVCNPPWVPARPASPLEHAVYDPDSRMLRGFLSGLAAHLAPGGEGWLILSDLAEHLGLRTRDELLAIGRSHLGLNRGLGHFQTDQVVGHQRAPDFLCNPRRMLTAQGQCIAEHRLLEFAIAGFDLPATPVTLGHVVGPEATTIKQGREQNPFLAAGRDHPHGTRCPVFGQMGRLGTRLR